MRTARELSTDGQKFFDHALGSIGSSIDHFPDPRAGHHNTKYKMREIVLGGFSVFFMRNASFLEAQRQLESAQGINNLRSIFGVDNIPTDNYIRSILDSVAPSYLEPVFKDLFSYLENSKHIDEFRVGDGRLLIAIDGTRYHSSKKIYCEQCNSSEHKNGDVTFSHGVVMPVLVKPGRKQVLPLFPEFIVPQDGHVKQDCENAAAKRLIVRNAAFYREKQAIILGDALYCCQPLCQLLNEHELDFVFVCKPTSHEVLFKHVEELSATGTVKTLEVQCEEKKKLVTYKHRYLNKIPLRGGSDAINVNWCEVIVTNAEEEVLYKSTFATSIELTEDNVAAICEYGRCRWKIENENNNTLKNLGYNLEHNFGHGKLYPSSMLASLNILAFLMHSALEIVDEDFARLVEKLKRSNVLKHAAVLTCYICFGGWQHLVGFMLDGFDKPMPPPKLGEVYYHPRLIPLNNSP